MRAYLDGHDARSTGVAVADLLETVEGLVALARQYRPAQEELSRQQKSLASAIIANPATVSRPTLELFVEISRATGSQAEEYVVFKSVAHDSSPAGARSFLAYSLLSWMHKNRLYQDIVQNRDSIAQSVRMRLEIARVSGRTAVDDGAALYEALLAAGDVVGAQALSADLLGAREVGEARTKLIDAARRAAKPDEVERLGGTSP
jgi:hypothetical protein